MRSTPIPLDATSMHPDRLGVSAALVLGLVLTAVVPAAARVQLASWSGNIAYVSSRATAGGIIDQDSASPPGPGTWLGQPASEAYDDENGAEAAMAMLLRTSFNDSIFTVSSSGAGGASGPGASIQGGALVYVQFMILRTQSFETATSFTAGTFGSNHTLSFLANMSSKDLGVVLLVPSGPSSGRIAPGIYAYYLENYFLSEATDGSANALTTVMHFHDVPNPLIDQHPQDQTAAPGASVSFSVGTSGLAVTAAEAPQALTYQWRRRYQNLTDGGRISGANTNQLQIANVAVADTGIYDCIVTSGSIQEPSSVARLTVGAATGVDDERAASGLSLSTPVPSPFTSRTVVRFALSSDSPVTLDVLDVGGRRIRSLVAGERYTAGTHVLEWDGHGDQGDRLPSGMYFVRLTAGSDRRVRRVVRIAN